MHILWSIDGSALGEYIVVYHRQQRQNSYRLNGYCSCTIHSFHEKVLVMLTLGERVLMRQKEWQMGSSETNRTTGQSLVPWHLIPMAG